jgi:hypothetical protein
MEINELTIITITLKDLEGLRHTFESLKTLLKKGATWIVKNGAAQDVSSEYISKVMNPNWKMYLVDGPDNGRFDAMNIALAYVKTQYVLFLNSGDTIRSKVIVNNQKRIGEQDLIVFQTMRRFELMHRFYPSPVSSILVYSSFPHPSTIIATHLFKKYGYYDSSYQIAGDYEWFLRVVSSNSIKITCIYDILSEMSPGGISVDFAWNDVHRQERLRAYQSHALELYEGIAHAMREYHLKKELLILSRSFQVLNKLFRWN